MGLGLLGLGLLGLGLGLLGLLVLRCRSAGFQRVFWLLGDRTCVRLQYYRLPLTRAELNRTLTVSSIFISVFRRFISCSTSLALLAASQL